MDLPYIIAEVGINHNGDHPTALRLVEAAIEAGASVVKGQYYDPIKLLGPDSPYLAYATKCQFTKDEHEHLARVCETLGIPYAVSVFDPADVYWASGFSPFMKVASRMNRNAEFISACLKTGRPVIMSIQKGSFHVLPAVEREMSYMWCAMKYPATRLDYSEFPYSSYYGISSHCPDWTLSVEAARQGARIFENHLTLNRMGEGCDHTSSLEPHELKMMVQEIKEICA